MAIPDLRFLQPGGIDDQSMRINPHVAMIAQVRDILKRSNPQELTTTPFFESHVGAEPLDHDQLRNDQAMLEDLFRNERYRRAFAVMTMQARKDQIRDMLEINPAKRIRTNLDLGLEPGEFGRTQPIRLDAEYPTLPQLENQSPSINNNNPMRPLYNNWNVAHAKTHHAAYAQMIEFDITMLNAFKLAKADRMTFIQAVLQWITDELNGAHKEIDPKFSKGLTAEYRAVPPPISKPRPLPPPVPAHRHIMSGITEITEVILDKLRGK